MIYLLKRCEVPTLEQFEAYLIANGWKNKIGSAVARYWDKGDEQVALPRENPVTESTAWSAIHTINEEQGNRATYEIWEAINAN